MPTEVLNERPPGQTKPKSSTPRRDKLSSTIVSVIPSTSANSVVKPIKHLNLTTGTSGGNPTSPLVNGRSHKVIYPGERELLQNARRYQDCEKEKQVKWFTAKGLPVPTPEELAELEAKKAGDLASDAAILRQEDRNRKQTEVGHIATVPCAIHPLYMDEEAKEKRTQGGDEPIFGVVAATGIGGRQLLQSKFSTACFTALLRARAERRLNKALQARAAAQNQSAMNNKGGSAALGGGSKKRGSSVSGGGGALSGLLELNLTLMTLPSALSTGEASGAATAGGQQGAAGATSASAHSSNQQSTAPAHDFPEAPSSVKVELFHAKPMQKPLEFKRKDYHQIKFSEHPYNNADLPEPVVNLPAGLLEAPEAKAGVDRGIGTMVHFQQPLVTLETYKAVPFSFSKKNPQSNLVLGVEAQPVTDGGFLKPHDEVKHGQGVPSFNQDGDFVGNQLLRRSLPTKMKFRSAEDDLSDTDDDEGTELPCAHPQSLLMDIGDWLPPFGGSTAASSSTVGGALGDGANPTEQHVGATTSGTSRKEAAAGKGGAASPKAGGTTAVAPTPPPPTFTAEEEEKRQQQHLDSLTNIWLGSWGTQPMHHMATRVSNAAFLTRRTEAHDYVHVEALGTVPGPLKKIM